jgi:hypothetical protein
MNDYQPGDIIRYAPFGGGTRRVRVEYRESDIKNGYPGFVGTMLDDNDNPAGEAWGYDDQIL